jgi:hypothetical protein
MNNTINTGHWTKQEHIDFTNALKVYGKKWACVAAYVGTRNKIQCRTHDQKFERKKKIQFSEKKKVQKAQKAQKARRSQSPPPSSILSLLTSIKHSSCKELNSQLPPSQLLQLRVPQFPQLQAVSFPYPKIMIHCPQQIQQPHVQQFSQFPMFQTVYQPPFQFQASYQSQSQPSYLSEQSQRLKVLQERVNNIFKNHK